MSALTKISEFLVTTIAAYINELNKNWLTQCFLYLIVLDIVVSSIYIIRGSK